MAELALTRNSILKASIPNDGVYREKKLHNKEASPDLPEVVATVSEASVERARAGEAVAVEEQAVVVATGTAARGA